jgi:hypothetical protein
MNKQFSINEKIDIKIHRSSEPNFDKACEVAYQHALGRFGCTDAGHLDNVKDSERSRSTVVVEFVGYRHYGGMGGQYCFYSFTAWVEQEKED